MTTTYANAGERQAVADPHIIKLEALTKIRPLDNSVAEWRTHAVQDPHDPQKVTMVVCPGSRSCPLCRKPCGPRWDEGFQRFEQYWPMSKRFAANVWDHGTNSVKVLIAGPQVFDVFKEAANVGINPGSCDWTISREGKARNTTYKVIRHDSEPGPAVTPDDLHDISKYETPMSVERIFETLERYGIDYDTLPIPSFTLDEALAYRMPYTKHKGSTIEDVLDADEDFARWLYGTKLEQNMLGDPIFLVLQVALESRGLAEPLDDALAHVPAPQIPIGEQVTDVHEHPVVRDPAPDSGEVQMIAPNGAVVNIPRGSVESLKLAGFEEVQPEPEQAAQDPNAIVTVLIGSQAVSVPFAQAEVLVASGTAAWPQEVAQEPTEAPAPQLPAADELVEVDIRGTLASLPFAQAYPLVKSGNAEYTSQEVADAVVWHHKQDSADNASVAAQADAEQVVVDDPERPNRCPHCNESFKSKGGMTKHINAAHGKADEGAAVAATPVPAATTTADSPLLDRVKDKLARAPFAKDYKRILAIFDEETGKKNIAMMSDEELGKVETRVDAETALAV